MRYAGLYLSLLTKSAGFGSVSCSLPMDVYLTKAPPHTQKTLCHTEDTCLQQPVQVQQSSVVTAAESLQTEAHKKKGS